MCEKFKLQMFSCEKRSVMFLDEQLHQYMYSFKNKVSDSVIFIKLTVVYICMCVCLCV